MSAFSELQDARAAARAAQQRPLADAKEFCEKLRQFLIQQWEIPDGSLKFARGDSNGIRLDLGEITDDDEYVQQADGRLCTRLVVKVDESLAVVPLTFSNDSPYNAFTVTVEGRSIEVRHIGEVAKMIYACVERRVKGNQE